MTSGGVETFKRRIIAHEALARGRRRTANSRPSASVVKGLCRTPHPSSGGKYSTRFFFFKVSEQVKEVFVRNH